MSTNRTKIDWAYKAAEKWILKQRTREFLPDQIRALAALLRRQYQRGKLHRYHGC